MLLFGVYTTHTVKTRFFYHSDDKTHFFYHANAIHPKTNPSFGEISRVMTHVSYETHDQLHICYYPLLYNSKYMQQ